MLTLLFPDFQLNPNYMSAATFIAAIWAVIVSIGGYNPAELQQKDPSTMPEYEQAKLEVLKGGQGDLLDAG